MFALVLVALAFQEQDKPDPPEPKPAPVIFSAWEAARAAAIDLEAFPVERRPFVRYAANPSREAATHRAVAFVVNAAINRTSLTVPTVVIADGLLQRIELDRLAENAADLEELVRIWNRQAIAEPYFTVRRPAGDGPISPLGIDYKVTSVPELDGLLVSPSPALGEWAAIAHPETGTGTPVPIVRADWFVDVNFRTSAGGLYYDWIGITVGGENATRLEDYLRERGYSEAAALARGTAFRAAISTSGVTGRERRVTMLTGDGASPTDGVSLCAITDDPFADDVGASSSPIRNLRGGFVSRGREVILTNRRGLLEFSLWNQSGLAVTEVPIEIAVDRQIPAPFDPRLVPAVSCVRCHGPDSGWRPIRSAIPQILAAGVEVFGDVREVKRNAQAPDPLADVAAIAGLYTGDPEDAFRFPRISVNLAAFRFTGAEVPQIAQELAALVGGYRFRHVDAAVAAAESGLDVADLDASAVLSEAITGGPLGADGVAPIDPLAAVLIGGGTITRAKWEEIAADVGLAILAAAASQEGAGDDATSQAADDDGGDPGGDPGGADDGADE